MKLMNLFGGTKPEKKTYTEDFKKKAVKLASKIGVTKAAEELGVSANSIYYWQKFFGVSTLTKNPLIKNHLTKILPPAPIQDENGNLTFNLEGKTYSLNVNLEEERERVREEINSNSLVKYDWFKEETGKEHWVLYDTEMYETIGDNMVSYLHCKGHNKLIPIIPINATSCYAMFELCTGPTTINLSDLDTSRVTSLKYMFANCIKLISLDLSNFNTSNIINMNRMFCGCAGLTTLDLSNFDTSKVTDMSSMFSGCTRLATLDLSSFDTSKVIDMSCMFSDCLYLISLDLNNFNTGNVTDMHNMFCGCSSLTTLDLSNFDTSKVTGMSSMFSDCSSLTTLDLSNFDTSSVTDMDYMFYNCSKLISIYVSGKWNTNSVRCSSGMLEECYSLPNFSPEKTGTEMAKPVEEGGYLTLKR